MLRVHHISIIIFIFKGRDDVYESPWFAFKSFAFMMDRDTPRPTLNTVYFVFLILLNY